MKDIDSPTGIDLRPEPPTAVRLSKRAGIIGLIVVTAVIGLVGYGIVTRRQRTEAAMERGNQKSLTAAIDAGKVIAADIPAGVITAGSPQVARPDQSVHPLESVQLSDRAMRPTGRVRTDPVPPPPPAVRDLTPEERARAAAYRQELEAMTAPTAIKASFGSIDGQDRRGLPTRESDLSQMTALLRAMRGPTAQHSAVNFGTGRSAQRLSLDGSGSEADDYSAQNMQDRKESFLKSAGGSGHESPLKSSRVRPLTKYEIKAGWDIPAILEQTLNSDLPGEIRALVRENVYDTATGNYLLVPQGSRIVGLYDSRIAYGQDGVTIVWNRIIFPDGSSIDLEGMAGQDSQGRAGLRHDVDNHYRRLIGFATLTSAFSAAFQLSQSRRGGLLSYPSAGETAGSAVGQELSRLGADVTRRNLNIPPTIKVPVGFRFNVRVNRDLLFDAPYRPFRM